MNIVKHGVLLNTTPLVVAIGDMECPITATLSSADGSRAIELSTTGDGVTGWFTPSYDVTATGMINVSLRAPVSHVRFTGAAADAWRVQ